MMKYLGWLLGIREVESIDDIQVSLAAPWATGSGFWVVAGCVALMIASLWFYAKRQSRGSLGARFALGICRGLLLATLLVTLADPILRLSVTHSEKPLLYLVFDGTDSMAIEDELTDNERSELANNVGWKAGGDDEAPTRAELVRSLVSNDQQNLILRLQQEKQLRLEAFLFDGHTTSRLRKLTTEGTAAGVIDPKKLADQLTTDGQVTALGAALYDAGEQFGASNLAGVVMFSDFAHNSGLAPLGGESSGRSPAARVGVPIYTVGIGAPEAIDLAVDLQTDPKMKKAERTNVLVKLRQSGLNGRRVTVRVTARPLRTAASFESVEPIVVGQRQVTLDSAIAAADFPFTPTQAGPFEFTAEVDAQAGEIVTENNRASREVNIIDDYLRLMYVANEPDWEWRFIKEVFHRDKLVGMKGFRTYLASSDPQVRESNVLFLPTLTPSRGEFFANDVIFLGDMPRSAISDRFGEMLKEFVGTFGGGLVVIAGPRFGPSQWQGTPIADMLPVLIDPDARLRDDRDFELQLTPDASRYSFMQLGESDSESARGWRNLGRLPWYQPVAQLHEQGIALAEHPSDTCRDGRTPQPLIAIRQFGAGEVVYLGFDEMWRLRRMYGERYYRTFWSQLIYRLGMSHALGAEKRFVVRTDRHEYRAEEQVTLTVEAYDENFEALTDDDVAGRALEAELLIPSTSSAAEQSRAVSLPMLRPGVFEARVPVYSAGDYRLRVKDPVTGDFQETRFDVADVSAERRSAVRNVRLQEDLARETGGRSYELTNASRLIDDLQVAPVRQSLTRNHALWSTPLWFGLIVLLMLGEWLMRKLVHLT